MEIGKLLTRATLFLYIILITTFLSFNVLGATGDITAVRILEDGWIAEVDIEGLVPGGSYDFGLGEDNSLEDPTVIFNVVSEGYDSSGALGTINRIVYGTHWIRQAYPNHDLVDEIQNGENLTVKIALSDFIYNDDKAGGAGTSGTNATVSITAGFYSNGETNINNAIADVPVNSQSTLDYPKVIGRWAWPGYERVTEDFLVEAVAFHRFARYGKPIALIDFLAVDQSGNSIESGVTDMTITTRTGDANVIQVYATTMDIDALNANEVIDVNFVAYPWVGDEDSVLDSSVGADGVEQPNERLGPLYELNDKDGTYGVGYAYVSNLGNDGTGQVYSDQGSAETGNAYLTIENAAEGLKTYHNSNYGRDNVGGGVILLAEGDYVFPGNAAASLGASMDTWMIIKHASGTDKEKVIISNGNIYNAFRATRLKIEGITLKSDTGVTTIFGRTASDVLWLHNNNIDLIQTAPILSFKLAYATQNHITDLTVGFGSFSQTRCPYEIIRGNEATKVIKGTGSFYTVLGNKNIQPTFAEVDNSAGHQISDNSIFAYNSIFDMQSRLVVADKTKISHGTAIVQNILEKTSAITPLMEVSNSNSISNNVLIWKNTFVGEREILGYNSAGEERIDKLNWAQRFNIYDNWNNKDDTFYIPNSNRIGSWPVGYNVGSIGNSLRSFTVGGEFDGLYSPYGDYADYVDDNSHSTGAGSGNGNYVLNADSSAINIMGQISDPSFYWVLPYDFNGNPIYDSADAGAYEHQPEVVEDAIANANEDFWDYESNAFGQIIIQLNGNGSENADTYLWEQIAGINVTLEGADTIVPNFTAPQWDGVTELTKAEARLNFRLTVNSGQANEAVDEVEVYVRIPGDANGDNVINAFDLSAIRQVRTEADFNDDGRVNAFDVMILRQNAARRRFS